MEYISIAEAAEKWGITRRRVQVLCSEGRIPGLTKFGKAWAIPKNAEKPMDKRKFKRTSPDYMDAEGKHGANDLPSPVQRVHY